MSDPGSRLLTDLAPASSGRVAPSAVASLAPHDRIGWLRFVLAVGGLSCVAVTWRLWLPQQVFPRVPLIAWVCGLSPAVDAGATWGALAICVCGLLGIICGGASRQGVCRWLSLLVCASWLVLIVLDQHRMQPWVVHIGVSLLLACWAATAKQLTYLQTFLISIYLYSAVGKLDAQFLNTVGSEMAQQLLKGLGLGGGARGAIASGPSLAVWLAWVFPLAELCIGLGLLFKPTRAWFGWGAIGMHLMLIWILGPWGLHHAGGVLVWNSLFVFLDVLLFVLPVLSARRLAAVESGSLAVTTSMTNGVQPASRFGRMTAHLTSGLLLLALLVPLGERLGWVDHWLGWALYAPHSSRAQIQVSVATVEKLPKHMRQFVTGSAEHELLWWTVRSDRWSLAMLAAPVVPQQRFQLGIARAVADWVGPHEIRVVVQGPADRWTGRRRERTLTGRDELLAAADQFWFNTCPMPHVTGLQRRDDET